MRIRLFVMFAVLFLLVYCAYAGKGSAMGPVLGIAAVASGKRKERILELKGLMSERDQQRKAIFDKCDLENRTETLEERNEATRLEKEKRAFIEEHDFLEDVLRGGAPAPVRANGGVPFDGLAGQRAQSLGEAFVNSPEMTEWRGPASNPRSLSTQGFETPHVRVGSFFPNRNRAIVTGGSDTSAGAFIVPDIQKGIDASWMRPLTIVDLITRTETGSDLVEYVKETFTNNAAETPEATGINDGSGAAPLSEIAFELVQEGVKDITHYVVSTVNALMDATQVRGEIDNALIQGLEERLEDQILNGDGVGPNIKGILQRSGIGLQAFDTDIFTTTRRAKTKVMVNGKTMPTAFVFNPTVHETLDLASNELGQFYALGAPWGGMPATLWGVPRVVSLSPAVATYGLLADWRKAWLYDRQRSEVYAFNQHLDFAIRRLVAIMGVMRAAFAVKREAAFVRIAAA